MLRKPNLFLIGAMKSGTTYLSGLLGAHPEIFMCYPEEPSYFVSPQVLRKTWRYMWEQGYWRSPQHYLRLFAGAGSARWIGEASTNYTKLPLVSGVAAKIAAFNPQSRFVYVMRDPVQRTISHYWHMVRHHGEHRPMLRAIQDEAQYTDVSYYARQLRPYLELFGSERIATLTFEELTADPQAALGQLFRWLEVDTCYVPEGMMRAENVTPGTVEMARGWALLHRLRGARFWRPISPHVPAGLRRLGAGWAGRQVRRTAVSTGEVVEYLRPMQRCQTEELAELLGREFPQWTTLYPVARSASASAGPQPSGKSG
jgi:hypothetical protein